VFPRFERRGGGRGWQGKGGNVLRHGRTFGIRISLLMGDYYLKWTPGKETEILWCSSGGQTKSHSVRGGKEGIDAVETQHQRQLYSVSRLARQRYQERKSGISLWEVL